MLSPIRIIPLHPISLELVASVIHPLQSVFQTEISITPLHSNLVNPTYDDSRAQYNSTDIIKLLLETQSNKDISALATGSSTDECESKILGITSVDLFVPILTYVFGEAQWEGPACVVSTYRLDDTIYGLPADPRLLFERTLKEIVHELGHTYGLVHCKNIDCAMHSSTAVEDIDIKGSTLCVECRKKIGLVM